MPTVSAVIITKNEQDMLPDCMASLQWADEIVVVDSGSSDDTRRIAKEHGARVYLHEEWQGFGPQRQLAQSHANCDWVFWIDADERVSDELAQEIRQMVENDQRNCVYMVPRLSWVFGRYIRHSGWYPDYVARLYARDSTHYDDALVHEKVIIPNGMRVCKLSSDLVHFTYRDLHHYLVKSADYAALWADHRQKNNQNGSILQAVGHALACFIKMYILRAGWLDGKQGFLLALLSSHSSFIKYADLWVRQQPSSTENRQQEKVEHD